MLLLLACVAATPDTRSADTREADTDADTDTDTDADADTDADTDTVDTGPFDSDGDGAVAANDCDDADPAAHPGADEQWNDRDDDCDGVVDADGAWAGTIRLRASAIYEGRRYEFTLDCPFSGSRAAGRIDYTVTCTPDPDDPNAQRLLGASLVITPEDPTVSGAAWDDPAMFTSANGWDSRGAGVMTWTSFDRAEARYTLDGVSLDVVADGALTRTATR